MCGLTLSIRPLPADPSTCRTTPIIDAFKESIACRGPDSQRSVTLHFPLKVRRTNEGVLDVTSLEVKMSASVLGLRGDLAVQPLVWERGVLGWNGQVFEGLDLKTDENDTRKILERLMQGEKIEDVLRHVEGPYACIYLDLVASTIHYQLDPLSRRSLLVCPPGPSHRTGSDTEDLFVLSSCSCGAARQTGMEMRALLGGEGGVIDLLDIAIAESGEMDMSKAIKPRHNFNLPESSSSYLTRVAPINSAIPSGGPEVDSAVLAETVDTFIEQLRNSVIKRVDNIPAPPPGQSRVAVLFSGGIDCTFLAYMLHQCLPPSDPIDLINVAFALSPKTPTSNGNAAPLPPVQGNYDVPDRLSGRDAVDELRDACPGREWRFVEVDVPYEDTVAHRPRVVELMYPSSTEMDLSLAYPLYFASLGKGYLQSASGKKVPYTVQAKVYISGLGADEQLGGYSRHRHAFTQAGWKGLVDETQMDITRLPTRNLSRDDRIISSHARDARYPYLSLSFITYLSSLPIWMKCDPRLPPGQGDKRLLRLAVERVGMGRAAGRVKRAMQFGTRSAKVGGSGSGVKGPKAGERTVL
ncbi:hypothetical protein IAT38_002989 [Cryptococcus sp. DSM 104549]